MKSTQIMAGRARRSARAASVIERRLLISRTRARCGHSAAGPLLILAILLAGGLTASAQSNGVPAPDNYAAFSGFISDRNIFDPNRQPHYTDPHRPFRTTSIHRRGTPGIQLVGTMSYEKGYFAFFGGTSADLSQVLKVGDKIAGYTITSISASSIVVQSADQKTQFMNIGDGWRQDNGKWVFSTAGTLPVATSETEVAAPSGNDSSTATPATPSSATEQNDVLKRLMQLREKENQ
jgi:hypothetical protein